VRGAAAIGLSLGLGACAPEAPPSCLTLCDAVAEATSACLMAEGLQWSAKGYDDEADFLSSCETWAWEQAQLNQGALEELEEGCAASEAAVRALPSPPTCAEITATGWSSPSRE
jgi:hypothetical protein